MGWHYDVAPVLATAVENELKFVRDGKASRAGLVAMNEDLGLDQAGEGGSILCGKVAAP